MRQHLLQQVSTRWKARTKKKRKQKQHINKESREIS